MHPMHQYVAYTLSYCTPPYELSAMFVAPSARYYMPSCCIPHNAPPQPIHHPLTYPLHNSILYVRVLHCPLYPNCMSLGCMPPSSAPHINGPVCHLDYVLYTSMLPHPQLDKIYPHIVCFQIRGPRALSPRMSILYAPIMYAPCNSTLYASILYATRPVALCCMPHYVVLM